MGKKMHTKNEVSSQKTEGLGISDLLVLGTEGDDKNYYAVHKRYFNGGKSACPACGSTKTRCSKVIRRKFKDILWEGEKSWNIIDLHYYQRYLRCDGCKESVFPEIIDFGQKGCRYTNRLSDRLAEGTSRYSYKKVCDFYGVPASTASVGAIMRRRNQYKESLFEPIVSPKTLSVVEVVFHGNIYPVILAMWDDEVYCLDILESNSEESYVSFFRMLNADGIETVCIEPEESLRNAVSTCFPLASVVMTGECVFRYAQNAMLEIIHTDGKRFPVMHKDTQLTIHAEYLKEDRRVLKQIAEGMKSRPRLKKAYDYHQELLLLLKNEWAYEELAKWTRGLPEDLHEFANLIDMIEIYEVELRAYLNETEGLPESYTTSIQAICDAFHNMPKCIFDVLRARSILSPGFDTIEINDEKKRRGIKYDRLIKNMNDISNNIKEEREYGLEK